MPSQCRDSLVETRESRTPFPSLVCEKILFIVSKHDSKSNHFWRKTDFINYDIYIFFNRAGSMLHSSFYTLEVLEEVWRIVVGLLLLVFLCDEMSPTTFYTWQPLHHDASTPSNDQYECPVGGRLKVPPQYVSWLLLQDKCKEDGWSVWYSEIHVDDFWLYIETFSTYIII